MATALRIPDRPPHTSVNRASTIAATDGELLMRFVRQRDQCAFAEIVERHGRLVWMICRQVLRHHQDVEDAFQATFLILAQRARSIHASDSAAAWLYKVAMRTALAARRKRSTRREEPLAAEPAVGEAVMPIIDDREMLYVLLQEVRLLPARYQTPLVMRYLEGQSRRAIAEQTDSTVGQVQGRLARGRRILRSRFLRRGVSLSLAAGAVASTKDAAAAAVSPSVVESTAATCLVNKISGSATGITPAAMALAKEGVQAMWFALATKCTAIVTAITLAGGIVWAAQKGGGGETHSASGAKTKIEIKSGSASPDSQPSTTATESSTPHTRPTALQRRRNIAQTLARRYNDAWEELKIHMDDKAQKSTRLEVEQLEKAAVQRKIEHLQNWLAELDAPPVDSSGEALPKDKQEKRQNLSDTVNHELQDATKQFKLASEQSATAAAELERAQIVVAQKQREIDELSRARMQTELALEMSNLETADGAAQKPEHTGKLRPGDAILIKVSNALSTDPIADVFYVESTGTIALGPAYGRVKVSGLSILEAEQAVNKHLAEILKDPQVQVSEPPPQLANPPKPDATYLPAQPFDRASTELPQALQATTAKLQEMSAAIEQLRVENTKLKKDLEQLSSKPIGHTR